MWSWWNSKTYADNVEEEENESFINAQAIILIVA
jgi:hypothetical protein